MVGHAFDPGKAFLIYYSGENRLHSLSVTYGFSRPPNNTLNTQSSAQQTHTRVAGRGPCELTHAARIPTASCPDVSVWSVVCVWRPPAGSVAMAVSDCLSHLKGFALSPFHQIACRPSLEELEGFAFSPSHCLLPSVDRFCVISDRFTGSLLCAVHTWVSALIYLSIYLSIANRVV